jgi:hypothetical protein
LQVRASLDSRLLDRRSGEPGSLARVIGYVRIYADEAGESHFEDVELAPSLRRFPTSPSRDLVSDPVPVASVVFRDVVEEHPSDEPHCAPERLFIVHLQGEVEVTVSDGEKRTFGTGSVVLVEDTHGRGHVTRSLGVTPRRTLLIPVEASG